MRLFDCANKLTAKSIFQAFYNRADKKFGQNFLLDPNINRKIVAAGNLFDKVVMEVGPGPGGITLEILKQPIRKLYIIELDLHWAQVWQSLASLFEGRLEVIHQDALNFNEAEIAPQVIISNLPYNISTQLLLKWLKNLNSYEMLILMFQKEVADRLYAKPHTRTYGKLSVLTQWKASVEKIFDLEPGCFVPPPKVKSTVVRLKPKTDVTEDFQMFSKIINDVFQQKRKQVLRSLSKYIPDAQQLLLDLGYSPMVRAEEISVEDFRRVIEFKLKNVPIDCI